MSAPPLRLAAPAHANKSRCATDHIINNVTEDASGKLRAEPLNDANGVFQYKGLFHVMCAGAFFALLPHGHAEPVALGSKSGLILYTAAQEPSRRGQLDARDLL